MSHYIAHKIGPRIACGHKLHDAKLSCRDRPGFVRAQNVRAGEPFDGFHFLYKGAFHRQPPDADDKGHGSQKNQSLRYHADHARNRADDRLREDPAVIKMILGRGRHRRRVLSPVEQKSDRYQRNGDITDNLLNCVLHLRRSPPALLCLADQLRRIAVPSHLVSPHDRIARDNEAAGHQFLSRIFPDRFGFTCQHGFIDFKIIGGNDRSVRNDLVSCLQMDDLPVYNLFNRYIRDDAVSQDGCLARCDDVQVEDHMPHSQFLDNTYGSVADDNP